MKHGRFALVVSVAVTAAIATAVLLGMSPSAAPAVGVRTAAPAYPNSIAAIGHSDTNGSGVRGPRTNWPHSSWVTGDGPAVQSLYSRILARNPAIRGNKFNLAINGADAASMLLQAKKAVGLKPAPELVVVHGIDNDIACDTVSHKPLQVAFASVLETLAAGLPEARIFVVSQFGSATTLVKALTIKQRLRLAGPSRAGAGRATSSIEMERSARSSSRTSRPLSTATRRPSLTAASPWLRAATTVAPSGASSTGASGSRQTSTTSPSKGTPKQPRSRGRH